MFAEMPLDNDTVDQCPALAGPEGLAQAYQNVGKTSLGGRNDLKFRHQRLFCNIEPQKRQYG
jgi:hypothetical protein